MMKTFAKIAVLRRIGFLSTAMVVAAVCTTGCNKDKDAVGTTTTTSSEIELNTGASLPLERAPAVRPTHHDDYLATVRREQMVLRGRIDEELRNIDRQLAAQRHAAHPDKKAIADLSEKRETLKADSVVVDRADERGWDELKAVVEHDLQGQPQM